MSNLLDFIDTWPAIPGNTTDTTKKKRRRLKSLATTIRSLQDRLEHQDRIKEEQKEEIERLKGNTGNNTFRGTYSSLVAGTKNSELENVLLTKIRKEINEMSKIENNIVISCLEEFVGENSQVQNESIFDDLLNELKIDKELVKRRSRLRKKGTDPDPLKPSLLLLGFKDSNSQKTALTNSSNLRTKTKFTRVYVNMDKTSTERAVEANLRRMCNEKNEQLQHEEGDRSYGIGPNGKKFYSGIRGGLLTDLEHRSQ
ncbi:unnamed protein product [Brachionus calyciflorus]|uniref:Uncharacterized protein n=1 Tax=Brachionus calyciflorus TaxID=104777 RepID=A0A813Y7Y1_9BILA|nr:unnamed protein product [Brachionus calyciflorus]